MDPISSGAIQPSIQVAQKPENAEADMKLTGLGIWFLNLIQVVN